MLPANIKLIIDITLGDGWVGKRRETNDAYFVCEHGDKQMDYARYKEALLNSFGYATHNYCKVNNNPTSKNFGKKYYRFYTDTNKDFNTAMKHLYNKGRKTIDKHLLRDLDAESLAFWFMDDGCAKTIQYSLTKTTKILYEKKIVNSYKLSTNCFSYDENLLIVAWLKEKFGLVAKAKYYKNYTTCIYVTDIFNKDLLRNIIYRYVEKVPCMEYKLSYPHKFAGIPYTVEPRERLCSSRD